MATTSPTDAAPSPGPPEASTNVTAPPLATISPPPPSDEPATPPPAPDASETPATPPPTESPPPVVVSPPPADVTSPPPSPPASTPPAPGATPVPPTSPPPAKTTPNAPPSSDKSPAPASPVRTPPVPPSVDKTPGTTPATNVHSPPPPPIARSKASPDTPSNTNGNSGSSDLNLPVVIGVSAAVGAVIIILALVACICCLKKKKRRHDHYSDYGGGGRANQYYNGGNLPTKWSPPLSDPSNAPSPHGALPPPPGAPWAQPPPPPPPLGFNSSDMSSGPHGPPLPPPSPSVALGFGSKSTFTFEELSAATNGFSQGNLIGQGGFGYVYKGVLPNGKEVAVKQLKAGSGQGEREFQAEVEIISRVHHRYLVSLVGYCMAGSQRMLIYEFVSNGTLEYHLHGKGVPTMDWPTRLNIALGSAKGLAYLHEDCHPRIIHRDIKSANILLEDNFDAKVADFGLAKFTEDTNTHVSTRIMGTFGYLAPEYASSGKLTEKSDVFSFGVMLLELITGRRPVDTSIMDDSLVDWARPVMIQALAEDKFEDLVDPRLNGNYNIVEMQRMVASAAACVRHSARRRPKMSQIVRALEGDVSLEDLNEGIRPGQSMLFSSSSDYDSSSYTSNMRQFRRVALDSTDYGNEYSGPTSEYGLNPSDSSSSGEVSTGSRKHHH